MRQSLKIAVSLLAALLLFAGFAVFAFSGLFNILQTSFFLPRIEASYQSQLTSLADSIDKFHQSNLLTFQALAKKDYIAAAFAQSPPASAIQSLKNLSTDMQLFGVRLIGADGKRILFSSFLDIDVKQQTAGSTAWKNYNEDGSSISFDQLSTAAAKGNALIDDSRSVFVYAVPVTATSGGTSQTGTLVVYVKANDLLSELAISNIYPVANVALIGSQGVLIGEPAVPAAFVTGLQAIWSRDTTDESFTAPLSLVAKDGSATGYRVFSARLAHGGLASIIVPSVKFEMGDLMKGMLLVTFFLTVFLLIYLVLNLRSDPLEVLRQRVKRFQIELISELVESPGGADWGKWRREMEARKEEITWQIQRGIGRVSRKQKPVVDEYMSKSWSEIIELISRRSEAPAAPAQGVLDVTRLEALIQAALQNANFILPAARVTPSPGPRVEEINVTDVIEPAPETIPTLPDKDGAVISAPPKRSTVEALEVAEEAAAVPEEAELVEELESVEEAEAVEAIEAAEEAAAVPEEAEPVEELESVEEAEAVEAIEVAEEAAAAPEEDEAREEHATETVAALVPHSDSYSGTLAGAESADAEEPVSDDDVEAVGELEPVEGAAMVAATAVPLTSVFAGDAREGSTISDFIEIRIPSRQSVPEPGTARVEVKSEAENLSEVLEELEPLAEILPLPPEPVEEGLEMLPSADEDQGVHAKSWEAGIMVNGDEEDEGEPEELAEIETTAPENAPDVSDSESAEELVEFEELESVDEEESETAGQPSGLTSDSEMKAELESLVAAGVVKAFTIEELQQMVMDGKSAIVMENGVFRIKEDVYSSSDRMREGRTDSGLRELAQEVVHHGESLEVPPDPTRGGPDEQSFGGIGDLMKDEDAMDLSKVISADKSPAPESAFQVDKEKTNPLRFKRNGLDYDDFLSNYPRSFTHTVQMKSLVEVSRRVSAVSGGVLLKKVEGYATDLTVGMSEKTVQDFKFNTSDPFHALLLLPRKAVVVEKNPSEVLFLRSRFEQEDLRYMKRALFIPAVFRGQEAYLFLSFSGETEIAIDSILSKLIVE